MDRGADNHYPTMTLDDILRVRAARCALRAAAADAALVLWATAPMLPQSPMSATFSTGAH